MLLSMENLVLGKISYMEPIKHDSFKLSVPEILQEVSVLFVTATCWCQYKSCQAFSRIISSMFFTYTWYVKIRCRKYWWLISQSLVNNFCRPHANTAPVMVLLLRQDFKQERINQDRTKICRFFDFVRHFSIFLFEIFSIASQLSCEIMFKISCKNIEKCRRKTKIGPILVHHYQDRTKIGPFSDLFCNLKYFYLKFLA